MSGSILVTGGAGFIGSQVAASFLDRGWKVSIIDDLSTGREENIPAGAVFYNRDIADAGALAQVFEAERPLIVNHHAAQTSVRLSDDDPLHDLRVNLLGTLNLVVESVRSGVELFVFASTGGAIYGDDASIPTPEEAACRPASPYGVSKLGAEHYLEWSERTRGLPTLRLRYANVFGPRQDPHGEAGVVAIFSGKMLDHGRPVINGDGRQTRDYVFVDDVVEANILAVEKKVTGTYNVGTGRETDVIALFDRLARLTGFEGERVFGPARKGEQARSCLDATALSKRCGWKAATGLEEGLARTVEWFREKVQA